MAFYIIALQLRTLPRTVALHQSYMPSDKSCLTISSLNEDAIRPSLYPPSSARSDLSTGRQRSCMRYLLSAWNRMTKERHAYMRAEYDPGRHESESFAQVRRLG